MEHKKHPQKKHNDLGHDLKEGLKEGFSDAKEAFNEVKFNKNTNWKSEFMDAIEVIKLNKTKMKQISERKSSTTTALIFAILGSAAIPLGIYIMLFRTPFFSVADLLIAIVYYFVSFLLSVFILDIIAKKLFHGKGDFRKLFKVLGFGYLIMVPGIIVYLLGLASGLVSILGIWYLVIMFKALQVLYKLSNKNTVVALIISIVVLGILGSILISIFGDSMIGIYNY